MLSSKEMVLQVYVGECIMVGEADVATHDIYKGDTTKVNLIRITGVTGKGVLAERKDRSMGDEHWSPFQITREYPVYIERGQWFISVTDFKDKKVHLTFKRITAYTKDEAYLFL